MHRRRGHQETEIWGRAEDATDAEGDEYGDHSERGVERRGGTPLTPQQIHDRNNPQGGFDGRGDKTFG
jgi:hypothetical protein